MHSLEPSARSGVRATAIRSRKPRARTIRSSLLVGLLTALGLLAAGCLARTPAVDATARCTPSFPDDRGWYGGDSAFSVSIASRPDRARLWLFGDSFVERPESPGRRAYPMIPNTIGLSTCDDREGWALTTHWRSGDGGRPRPFFAPDPDARWVAEAVARSGAAPWYWPFGGFEIDGRLYVGLLRVVTTPPHGPFRLPFDPIGMDLARIDDPSQPPARWQVEITPLSEDPRLLPGAAFVVSGEHVYAFAFFDAGDAEGSGRALLRWPRAQLLAGEHAREHAPSIETWGRDDRWHRGLQPTRAARLLGGDATEMSVHFDAKRARWVAVDMRPVAVPPSADVIVRVWSAPRLTGPWSGPAHLATGPPPDVDVDPARLFCYAGKAHPRLDAPLRVWITYVCSVYAPTPAADLVALDRLATSEALYRPVPVAIPAERFARAVEESALRAVEESALRAVEESALRAGDEDAVRVPARGPRQTWLRSIISRGWGSR